MCAYEVVEFSTNTCQGEEVIDGEVSYDENEDVRWQGEKEEHDPESRVGAHILILSTYRPDPIRVGDSSFLARDSLRLPLYHNSIFLESMRRDVRILLVGDGTRSSIVVLVAKLNTMDCTSQGVLVKVPLSPRSSRRHTYPMSVPIFKKYA